MNFNLSDHEQHFEPIKKEWEKYHNSDTFNYVGNILECNYSLWHTNYGLLYQDMCRYYGYKVPPLPPRVRDSKYIVVIYKRYEC